MENNKKIVIFEFQDLRYASRARKEAFSLSKNGFDVTLVGFSRVINKKNKYIERGVYFVEVPFLRFFKDKFIGKVLNIFLTNIFLTKFLIINDFNIYHLHDLKLFFPALIARVFKNRPLIYDAHELHIKKRENKSYRDKILSKYDEIKERILIKLSKGILQASDLRAEYFQNYYKTKKPIVIENHENLININNKVKDIKTILGLSDDSIILIYTGNISIGGNQNIVNVIKALAYLPENIHFCLMGRGSENTIKKLLEIADDINIKKRFHIIPPVKSEEVVSTISSADIGIIPIYANCLNSEYSALNKLSQSLMAGLAIASSDYENMRKVIFNNKIGVVGNTFNVESIISIADSIKFILNSNLKEMKIKARLLAETELNWENEEKKLIDFYDSTLI